ncbi:MAG: hypothetical protein WC761_03640 [Candidatus Paceibacterota bacterium]|jgi:hypothetical protein
MILRCDFKSKISVSFFSKSLFVNLKGAGHTNTMAAKKKAKKAAPKKKAKKAAKKRI